MTMLRALVLAALGSMLLVNVAAADKVKKRDTIKSLEGKTYKLKESRSILSSSELARDNYREFLDLVSDDPALRAEAMRRLGDLELEATESQQLQDNIDALDQDSAADHDQEQANADVGARTRAVRHGSSCGSMARTARRLAPAG